MGRRELLPFKKIWLANLFQEEFLSWFSHKVISLFSLFFFFNLFFFSFLNFRPYRTAHFPIQHRPNISTMFEFQPTKFSTSKTFIFFSVMFVLVIPSLLYLYWKTFYYFFFSYSNRPGIKGVVSNSSERGNWRLFS